MFNIARIISKLKFTIRKIKVISLTIIKYIKELIIIIIVKPNRLLY